MPLRVLMFGWEFPPHNSGGLGVACQGLTQALAERDVRVTFVLPKKIDVSVDFLKLVFADVSKSIKLKSIRSLLTPYLTSESYQALRARFGGDLYGSHLFDEVRRYAFLARDIAEEETFDIIHAHDWLSFAAGIEAKRVSGKPLVVHIHATEFDRTGGHNVNQFVYETEKRGMEEADAVVAVSNFTKNIIVRHYGIPPEKIHVVHNAVGRVSGERFNSELGRLKADGHKIVLFVGRLTLQKGPDYFIRAARKVLDYNPKVIFIIAGSGDMERRIMEEAAWLGISDKVLFTGFLRDNELAQVYQAADLYVMPSVSEPFGITVLESVAYGTPVLISKQSGVSEVLTHALKADFWDVDEMANKILAVLEHPPLRETLAQNGSHELKKIHWGNSADRCINLYSSVLGRARTPV